MTSNKPCHSGRGKKKEERREKPNLHVEKTTNKDSFIFIGGFKNPAIGYQKKGGMGYIKIFIESALSS